MILNAELRQFRCHRRLSIEFEPRWNFILGANGGGKSSILEAVYYLGRLKSFRTAQARELVLWQETGFQIQLSHQVNGVTQELAVRWERGRRTCYIDGVEVEGLERFWGQLPLVLLSSEDQNLVRGPDVKRLQWIDSLIAFNETSYLGLVQKYNVVIKQRNSLLRQGNGDRRLEDILRGQAAELGRTITEKRSLAMECVQREAAAVVSRLLPGSRYFDISYVPCLIPGEEPPWAKVAVDERRLGRTLLGPHRDEILLKMGGKSLGRFGSEGEQRLGSLILRLVEGYLIKKARGSWPLMLMDDILNPLDATRKQDWTREIPEEAQVILTTTAFPKELAVMNVHPTWNLAEGELTRLRSEIL